MRKPCFTVHDCCDEQVESLLCPRTAAGGGEVRTQKWSTAEGYISGTFEPICCCLLLCNLQGGVCHHISQISRTIFHYYISIYHLRPGGGIRASVQPSQPPQLEQMKEMDGIWRHECERYSCCDLAKVLLSKCLSLALL